MSRLSVAAAAILALALVPAAPAWDEAWVTLERGTAQQALIGLAAAGHPGALVIVDAGRPEALGTAARATDVVVARISVDDVELLPGILHAARQRCGGFMRHQTREEAEWAAARANNPEQRTPPPPMSYTIDNGPVVNAMLPRIQEPGIHKTIVSLGNFVNRRYTCPVGVQSATWIKRRWQAIAASRPGVTVDFYNHTGFSQPSVILTIPGSTLPTEVVVLGAHQDSINGGNSNCSAVAPGEDDDASGVASLTEVLKVALRMNYHPQRTVKFMAYAAEEGGLLGSQQIAAAYDNQNINVVGVLQLDMTNYKGSAGDIYIFTDFTNPTQNTFLGNLVTTYLPGLVKGSSACGYACSDHASWNMHGYPASFPFEATFNQDNPFIHTPQDTIENCGNTANHAVKFSKLAAAYMAEVAKGGFTSN
jgi:leucyl aminopeptidase